jgi:hypothetical protein
MAANQFGIDMGEIYRTTAAVKGARTANKLSELNLSEKEYDIAQRPKREAFQNKLTDLRGKAAFGGEGSEVAQEQLLSLDPENGPKFIEALATMDTAKRDAVKRSVDEMGQMSGYVLQGKTPEEQERRYQLVRGNMPEETQAKMPDVYDPQFMELSLAKSVSMDQLLEAPEVVSAGGKEQHYKGGVKVNEFNKPIKEGSGSGAGKGGLKSGDESLMYKQSAELLGGIFDQSGNITNLDPDTRNKVQAVTTEATKIFRDGGVTRAQAVTQAAKKYGFNIEDVPGQENPNDPLGLL